MVNDDENVGFENIKEAIDRLEYTLGCAPLVAMNERLESISGAVEEAAEKISRNIPLGYNVDYEDRIAADLYVALIMDSQLARHGDKDEEVLRLARMAEYALDAARVFGAAVSGRDSKLYEAERERRKASKVSKEKP